VREKGGRGFRENKKATKMEKRKLSLKKQKIK